MDRFANRAHVNIRLAEVKIRGAKSDGPILKGGLQKTGTNLIGDERGQIGDAVPRREVVIGAVPVCHRDGGLREFQIIPDAKDSRPIVRDGNQPREVDRACHTNEPEIGGATVRFIPVLYRLEDGGAAGDRAVLDFLAIGTVIAGNRQVLKVVPCGIEEAAPVENQPIDNSAAV